MATYPLAIYTAEHGLAWTYPREAIPFTELEACRKAFGPSPDFDAGDPGYEGVLATRTRVFALRCQSVPAWDFRGRAATYLAVTWVPREAAGRMDFEALLAAPALRLPTHTPPPGFDLTAERPPVPAQSLRETLLPDGFSRVGALIAGLAPQDTALFRRTLDERVTHVHLHTEPSRAVSPSYDAQTSQPSVPLDAAMAHTPTISQPRGLCLPWPAAVAAGLLWLLTLGGLGGLGWQLLSTQGALETTQDTLATSQDFLAATEKARDEVSQELDAEKQSSAELRKKCDDLQAENEAQEKRLNECRAERAAARQEKDLLEQKLIVEKQSGAELRKKYEANLIKQDKMKKELDALRQNLESKQQECTELRKQLEKAHQAYSQHLQEKDAQKAEAKAMQEGKQ